STPTRRMEPTQPLRASTAPAPLRPPLRPPGTAVVTPPRPGRPRAARSRVRRRRVLLPSGAALALVAALVFLLAGDSQPTRPAASAAKHHVARAQSRTRARPHTQTTTGTS